MKRFILIPLIMICVTATRAAEESIGTLIAPAIEERPIGAPVLRAPSIPAQTIALADTVFPADWKPNDSPLRIGYTAPLPNGLRLNYVWQEIETGGHVLKMEFSSRFAAGLRLRLLWSRGANEVEFRFYSPTNGEVSGPFIGPRLDEDGTWWSPTISGPVLGMEVFVPSREEIPSLAVAEVAHKFCDDPGLCAGGPGPTLACHNDVTCYPAWYDTSRAVAQISFISGGSCFSCSGALLNRVGQDGSPLFMTANHCISAQSEAYSVEIRWLYQTAVCNGAPPGWNAVPITRGSIIVKQFSASDWTLLGLYDPPRGNVPAAGNTYLGWTTQPWDTDQAARVIHHPRGSFKKISFGTYVGSTANFWSIRYPTAPSVGDPAGDGTTEQGSSGSPIMDVPGNVRGTLTSGPTNACAPKTDNYGRFDTAFPTLQYYLSTIATPVYVNGTVAGDPANGGTTEQGTAGAPFGTLYEATFCVKAKDDVFIETGNYPSDYGIKIWRPMTLRARNGPVTIGR